MKPTASAEPGSLDTTTARGEEVVGILDDYRTDRVLLVDDREENLMALEAVLEPLEYELVTARSGAAALRLLLSTDVSAVVLDVQMPDMDGFETAALLKSREATRTIPILFLTAVGLSVEHELRGYEVGAVDYVCKPFEPRVLQAKVRAAVRWGSELRALRQAARVYQEAVEALASIGDAGDAGHVAPGPTTGSAKDEARVAGTARAAADEANAVPIGPVREGGEEPRRCEPVLLQRILETELEASVSSPGVARAAVHRALGGVADDCVEVVVLLVSELVTNAVLHARSPVQLVVDVGATSVRVEVADLAATEPGPVPAGVTEEGGRGLLLVARLVDRYGWTQAQTGKSVWFELQRQP